MILEEKNKIQNTNIENFNSYKIDISSIAIKAMIDMYENKELAVVRELLTNAWDSHIAANNTNIPIDVDLFATYSNVFRIRDYGTGISEENMQNYCTIYHSSKRNSNEQTGCWGVGSKAPFVIVDNYLVISYYNGIKLSYLMSISDSIPKFSLLNKEETTEPNGLEIQITTDKVNDITEALKKFNRFVDIKLNIITSKYIEPKNFIRPNIIYKTNNFKLVDYRNNGGYYYYTNKFYIDYGNNIYSIEIDKDKIIQNTLLQEYTNNDDKIKQSFINFVYNFLKALSTSDLTLIFKIPLSEGLTITPSREYFEKTKENLVKIENAITTILINYFMDNKCYEQNIIFQDSNHILKYNKIELIESLINYIDNDRYNNFTSSGVFSYTSNLAITSVKKDLFNILYSNENIDDISKTFSNNILIINPNQMFTKGIRIRSNTVYNMRYTSKFFNSLFFSYNDYEINLDKKNAKVLILNSKIADKYLLTPERIITRVKSKFGNKREGIYEDLQKYDLVILVDKIEEYITLKPLLNFIRHHYGLNLFYSSLNSYLNKFRKNKKPITNTNKTSNSNNINRYKYFVHSYKIKTQRGLFTETKTIKEILNEYNLNKDNTKIKYCLLNTMDDVIVNKSYCDSIVYNIQYNLDKLPIGFQNKLNKISQKYTGFNLDTFHDFKIIFIENKKLENNDKIINYLKTKIDYFNLYEFYKELLTAINKLKIYVYNNFTLISNHCDIMINRTVLNNRNNSIKIPNNLANSLLTKFNKNKPTTEFGISLYKKLKRLQNIIYYSKLFNNIYNSGISYKIFSTLPIDANKTVWKLQRLLNYFYEIKEIKEYKDLINEIIKHSYRRY